MTHPTLLCGVKFKPRKSLAECASVLVEQNKVSHEPEQTLTKEILSELDILYKGTPLPSHWWNAKLQVLERNTVDEKKTAKWRLQRECRDHITKQLHKFDAITILAKASHWLHIGGNALLNLSKAHKALGTGIEMQEKYSPTFQNLQWIKNIC